jgi:hypothetical protein
MNIEAKDIVKYLQTKFNNDLKNQIALIGFIPGVQECFNICKSVNTICSWTRCHLPLIPATQGVKIRRITVQGQSSKSWRVPISTNKLGVEVHTCHHIYEESIDMGIIVLGWPQAKS